MKAVFFSDAHLKKSETIRIKALERFIQVTCADADAVFVLGDLFEFYYAHKGYQCPYPWYKGVIDALASIVSKGGSVYFIEGNHEFNLKNLQLATGIVCSEELSVTIDDIQIYVSHGDLYTNPLFRKFLKSSAISKFMEFLGPHITWFLAMATSFLLSSNKKGYKKEARDVFRGYAVQILKKGYDVVILGHTHIPDEESIFEENRVKRYYNTGGFDGKSTYVEYTTEDGFSIKSLSGIDY